MTAALNRQTNGTIELTITIPSFDVKKAWDEVIGEIAKNAEIKGFRKGKAPRNLVEGETDPEKVREEVLKKLLPIAYADAVKTHNLRPIVNPKIHISKLEDPKIKSDSKGWQFVALTCEAPDVILGKYKDNIKKITAPSKIIVPGKDPKEREVKFDDIVKALLENVSAKIPQILIDNEVERLLAQTLDEVKRLGLTLSQYLSSTKRSPETLRAEYAKKAQDDIKLEFALQKIAESEKITIEEKEIEEAIQAAKSDEERKNLETNRYLLASILRQQKTLDFLKNL